MFPQQFDYHRAASVAEAVDLLASLPDAKLVAGGHSLIPAMKLRAAQRLRSWTSADSRFVRNHRRR